MTAIMVKAGDLPAELPILEGRRKLHGKDIRPRASDLTPTKATCSIADQWQRYYFATLNDKAAARGERTSAVNKGVDPRRELKKTPRGKIMLDVVEVISPVVKERLTEAMAETFLYMKTLESRVIELENATKEPSISYCGVWTEGEYEKNSAVTHVGSLWIAKRKTRSKPQPDAAEGDWQLAVRRGRDGKDAK